MSWGNAFLNQARSDWEMYLFLKENQKPSCHELHYLQMTTEKLSKAATVTNDGFKKSHKVFVKFLRSITYNSFVYTALADNSQQWRAILREIMPVAESIEQLAPDISTQGSNSEYPWEQVEDGQSAIYYPANFVFPIHGQLQETSSGRKLLKIIGELLNNFEKYYPGV